MSKRFFGLPVAIVFFSSLILSADVPLTPYPNRLELGQGVLRVGTEVSIEAAGDDRFSASLLSEDLKSVDGVTASVGPKGTGWPRIVLALLPGSVKPNIRKLLENEARTPL